MSNFLFHDEEESYDTVDIDSLFEKKQQKDLKQLSIFNKNDIISIWLCT